MARKGRNTGRNALYSVHPGIAMAQKWVAELKQKTGRSLDEWLRLVKTSGPATAAARCDWLKKEHGFGTNSAWWIAERASGKSSEEDTPDGYLKAAVGYVEDMFAGKRAALKPMYDRLLKLGLSIADDVKACPCKTMVPLYREHVIAQIKPTTNTRIDFGFALKHAKGKLPKRLIDTGGAAKGDRITHRIPITSLDDIDAEVERWLKVAYDLDD